MTDNTWQLLPDLSADEYSSLKADIAVNGIHIPVVVDAETGAVMDGHHRVRAWQELRAEGVRLADYPRQVRHFAGDDERLAFVVAANLFRRHLTRHQRAELVTRLRERGWSLRRISGAIGVHHDTVREDLAGVGDPTPARVEGADRKWYPARRPPPSVFVASKRDEARGRKALQALGENASGLIGLARAEERARLATLASKRGVDVPAIVEGAAYELRLGDFHEVLADVADASIDAVVTDPPYNVPGIPLFEELGSFALRVLKPGRLAVVYAGHLHLDEEMELLARGGLSYMWHGTNVLKGRHTRVRTRMVFGQHRSVLMYSAGPYKPRRWLNDVTHGEGHGGPDERPLHPWQQALEPVRHWVRQVSEPGELVCDPFIGSGTTAVACMLEGRRFLGCDIDPACVETTRLRLEELASATEAGS